jgi:hypothetical protein
MSERVTLRGGLTVDVTALRILLRLEELGCTMAVVANCFAWTPGTALEAGPTKAQADAIVEHRADLTRLVRYVQGQHWEGGESGDIT